MKTERDTFSTRRFLVGRAGPFPRLVFRESVMQRLDEFAHLHAYGEHGGFLIGRKRALESTEQYEILVERFVPIPQQKDASRLVINREHHETVSRAIQEAGQEEEIVGWAHTHPGFGVFLSNFDKEQHQRFFPQPWQIAYVMDTHAQERAAFYLVGEAWHRLDGYYVLRTMPAGEIGMTASPRALPWVRLALLAVFLASVVAMGIYGYGWLRGRMGVPVENPETVAQPIPAAAPELPILGEEELALGAEAQPTEEPQGETTASAPAPREYTVAAGDNLWRIAEELWGDPRLFYLLAEENGIENPSIIHVGRVLRVPVAPLGE